MTFRAPQKRALAWTHAQVQIKAVRDEKRHRQQRLVTALKEEGGLIAMVKTGNTEGSR